MTGSGGTGLTPQAARAAIVRHRYTLAVLAGFVASRVAYWKVGIRIDVRPLDFYMQFVDPELLRTDLLRSLFYLRDQPPLFSLFLGLVLKAFPTSYERGFQAAYLGMGAVSALACYALARRFQAGPRAAAVIALALSCSPTAVLYENWLFYAYPLGVLWILVGLSLDTVLRRPTVGNAALASGALAVLGLTRGTVHVTVIVAIVAALLVVRRRHARALLVGAAVPTLLVVALYVKHALVFGGFVIGGFYRGVNIAAMQQNQLGQAQMRRLEAEGAVPPGCPYRFTAHTNLEALITLAQLEPPPVRGVPILDRPWKSTHWANWNSSAAEVVGLACGRMGLALRRARPQAYGVAVRANLKRFVAPADRVQPLRLGDGDNPDQLQSLSKAVDRLAFVRSTGVSMTVVAGLALALLVPAAGAVRLARRWRRGKGRPLPATFLVAVFSAGMLAYSATLAILFSWGDQNRYRAELMPLVWIVVGSALVRLARCGLRVARSR